MTEWDRVISLHAEGVFRVAFRILGSEHDAEDVAQEVFCEAFELADPTRVHDWGGLLRRMAAFRSIDHLRRRRSSASLNFDVAMAADPSSEAVAKEMAERLREALLQLSDQQAVVFSLAHFESLSRDEIAQSLGVAPVSVSTALYKARQKLKSLLVEMKQELSDD